MSNDNVAWELDSLGPQLGSYKREVLDLESRVVWSERFVSQHERDIRQIRYEAAKVVQQLQGQIQEHARTIKGLRRFVGLLAKFFFAAIGAFSAWLIFEFVPDDILSSYVPSDIYWKPATAIFVFLIAVLVGDLLFRALAASKLSEPHRKQRHGRRR
jgi:hypothetical protein